VTSGRTRPGQLGLGTSPDVDPATEDLTVRVLGHIGVDLPTCSGLLAGATSTFGIGDDDRALGAGAFDTPFALPHEAIGMGKVIQLLDRKVTGAQCPGYMEATAACVLEWKATVTFERTGQRQIEIPDEDIFVPLEPKPAPEPAPPDDDLDDLFVPLKPRAGAKLSPDGGQASVTVTCPAGCSGSVAAYPASGRARASAARALARKRFTAAAGRKTTVVVRFTRAARRRVKRAGVRLALRIAPAGGGEVVSRNLALRLRR
jgi:hypothetical protein